MASPGKREGEELKPGGQLPGEREGDTAEQAFSRACAFALTKVRTGTVCPGGYARGNVLGSYLHLNLMGCPEAADRFLQRCLDFRRSLAW